MAMWAPWWLRVRLGMEASAARASWLRNTCLQTGRELADFFEIAASSASNLAWDVERSGTQALAGSRQGQVDTALVLSRALAPHQALRLQAFEQRRQRAGVQPQALAKLRDAGPSCSQSTSITRYCG